MRKLIVLSFISLDGVMQAPGGPEEDGSGAFGYGGWSVGYWDNLLESTMAEQMGHPFDLLLGRRTYDIFAAAWPTLDSQNAINHCRKYVVTHRPLPPETEVWKNSVALDREPAGRIARLKNEEGPEIQVHGSGELIQMLLKNGLVDELWLKIYPLTLGRGKRLFGDGTGLQGFDLTECKSSPSGVIVANYRKGQAVKFGSF